MKQNLINTAAGALAAALLCGAGAAYANPYPVGSQQWHNHNSVMQSEADRIQRERNASRQQPINRGPSAAEVNEWHRRERQVQSEIAELRRTPFWMAIAYDFDTRQSMWSGGHASERRAVEEALKQCRSSNCRVIKTFANTCAAVVEPDSRAKSAADLFVALDKDDRQAASKAMRSCEARHGSGNCSYWQVRKPFCTGYDYSVYGQ